jgi:FMN-dependent NADH-azoreductase
MGQLLLLGGAIVASPGLFNLEMKMVECFKFETSPTKETAVTLFRLDASIRVEGSRSRALGDLVEREWRSAHPGDEVVRRHLGTDPVPATAWARAVSASFVPAEERTPEQRDATALAATLVDELVSADALLFAVPLYNFGVSQHFKTYVDLVVTDPRMAAGQPSAIAGRPAVLATVRGGAYGAGTPREGWDHATPWMRRILEDVWGLDLRSVEEEFGLVGVNPALDEFADAAEVMRAEAAALASEHGRSLAATRRRAA